MAKRVLLVASVLFAVVGATTLLGRVSTAGKVPNHGYPIAGSQCGMVNALSVNTPVATRNARMVCLPNMTGSLSWTREPTKGGRCAVSGQIWGALTCTGEKWSAENKTFCCSFSDATAELRRVLVLVHTSRTTDPAPPSGSTFVTNQYVRSPVDVELRDRLATAGFELSMTKGTYVLKSGTETTCVRWIDRIERGRMRTTSKQLVNTRSMESHKRPAQFERRVQQNTRRSSFGSKPSENSMVRYILAKYKRRSGEPLERLGSGFIQS